MKPRPDLATMLTAIAVLCCVLTVLLVMEAAQ